MAYILIHHRLRKKWEREIDRHRMHAGLPHSFDYSPSRDISHVWVACSGVVHSIELHKPWSQVLSYRHLRLQEQLKTRSSTTEAPEGRMTFSFHCTSNHASIWGHAHAHAHAEVIQYIKPLNVSHSPCGLYFPSTSRTPVLQTGNLWYTGRRNEALRLKTPCIHFLRPFSSILNNTSRSFRRSHALRIPKHFIGIPGFLNPFQPR